MLQTNVTEKISMKKITNTGNRDENIKNKSNIRNIIRKLFLQNDFKFPNRITSNGFYS